MEPMLFSGGIWLMRDPGRRLKTDRAGMAARREPLHEEGHVLGRDAELVLQDAAGPQRRSLYIFRHADALASQIGGTRDLGVLTHVNARMVEAPRREHRNADEPVIAPVADHHELRHRHFGNVELGEAELPPKHFRGAQHGLGEIDAVGFDAPVDDRPGARITGDGETELQIGHASSPPAGASSLSRSSIV